MIRFGKRSTRSSLVTKPPRKPQYVVSDESVVLCPVHEAGVVLGATSDLASAALSADSGTASAKVPATRERGAIWRGGLAEFLVVIAARLSVVARQHNRSEVPSSLVCWRRLHYCPLLFVYLKCPTYGTSIANICLTVWLR